MKILAVGGGSGGHVTPVVAVLRELKNAKPDADIRFWCDVVFKAQATALIADFDRSIPVHTIASGKLRRYHHLSVIRQLLWPRLVLLNLRDGVLVGIGLVQSIVKLLLWRPDVVFTKGGYVCLPVGMAAKFLHIPLVIHDSDAHPGLTNRILATWATKIATGAPLKYYPYPAEISAYVGIPMSSEFRPFTNVEQADAKKAWNVNPDRPLIVITGGGLGAKRINDTVVAGLEALKQLGSVVLVAGASQYDELRQQVPDNSSDFQLHAFISKGMAQLLGAADVVVTRAGATTILELAALKKPIVLIPNAKLTGGHQLKNAKVYEDASAAVVLDEEAMMKDPTMLVRAVNQIVTDTQVSQAMAERLYAFARPDAAKQVADMIITASSAV